MVLRKDQLRLAGVDRSTADPAEIARFDRMADEWWKPDGKFRMVHKFNAARVAWLGETLSHHFGRDPKSGAPLDGLRLIDVGCGAGIVCEAMAGLGATVLGIDATARNVAVAERHAHLANGTVSSDRLSYRCALPEMLVAEQARFDIVLTLEVVEHVADLPAFFAACAGLLAPGGLLVVATLDRTLKSYVMAIVGAEYVLGWLPRGTHAWTKFVRPAELGSAFGRLGLVEHRRQGLAYDPIGDRWRLSTDTSVNYLMAFSDSSP